MSEDATRAGDPGTDPFEPLPDSARLWTFGVSRPLTDGEARRLLVEVDAFLEGWNAHGRPLSAARAWRFGRFLLVALDDTVTPPSGCSIDALVRTLREMEDELGIEMVGGAPVWYRHGGPEGPVRRASRPEFRAAAARGEITGDTIVFDPALTRLGELREGKWELPARECWHSRLLARAETRRGSP
jgi:hypothetical protein